MAQQNALKAEGTKLTWREFKEICERKGVQDNDELDIIDISWGDLEYFDCKRDEDFGWQITLRGI